MIQELLPQAERIAAVLKARGETISVAESSTAGLISAALLAVGGASAYFMGGAVVYTRASRTELLRVTEAEFAAMTGITPLLLLDEVVAHLDPSRRAALFGELAKLGAQVWMSGADPATFSEIGATGKIFDVDSGRITARG